MNQKTFLKLKALDRSLSKFKGRQLENIIQKRITVEQWMEKIIRDRFSKESERAYGGRKWKEKEEEEDSSPVLHKTGKLEEAAEEAVFNTYRIRGKIIWSIGRVNCPYAKFIQEGTETTYARPFFLNPDKKELKPADRRAVNLIAQEIRKALRR